MIILQFHIDTDNSAIDSCRWSEFKSGRRIIIASPRRHLIRTQELLISDPPVVIFKIFYTRESEGEILASLDDDHIWNVF